MKHETWAFLRGQARPVVPSIRAVVAVIARSLALTAIVDSFHIHAVKQEERERESESARE